MADDLANFEGKLKDESYLSRFANPDQIKTLEDLEKAMKFKYGDRTRIAKKLNYVRNRRNQEGTIVDKTVTEVVPPGITRDTTQTVEGGGDPGRPGSESYGTRAGAFSTYDRPGAQGSPGYHWAEGGRVGYQDGELVEDESMFEATPGGMMEENIEEVQGEPSREQLEAIAFEIFQLPLEELNEEQLEVVYQAAMEQEPSEEEVQFAAQEGPGEGIASLV